MIRTFRTHEIRHQNELTGKTWKFTPLDGEHANQSYRETVPSCWETYPGFENYRGRADYETTFQGCGNIRLEFKGVSHFAKVFVDDVEVASHYNAYTPFECIVKNLKEGSHRLKVEVENLFKKEYALNRPNDYMSYGGISRGVVSEEVGSVYIDYIHVTPLRKLNRGWKAHLEVFCNNISGEKQKENFKVILANNEFEFHDKILPMGKSMVIDEVLFFDNVDSWNFETPNLYEISIKMSDGQNDSDDLIDRVGFRTIKIKNNHILLNDKTVRIKGVNRHEDHPYYGCALPFSAIAYDLRIIQDLGANSIRTCHYPNDELFLDLCDELGILVWEEHHLRGSNEEMMRNPYFEPQAEQVIREMIHYHYNHPSIYIWGIMNECASETEYGRTCYEKQYTLIRSLDQSRLCSSATCKYDKDLCLDLPDVVSWNMYPYWYRDETAAHMLNHLYEWTQNEGNGAGKPFLVTEIGAGAIYGFRSPDHDKWTEEYQAYALKHQIEEVMAHKECTGLYIWQFCDNRVSKEYFGKRPRTRNNKGIVDEFRRHKLAYESVKSEFGKLSNYLE